MNTHAFVGASRKIHGRPASRAAFTLVELLVVIGIIAVLVGILLPTLGRARAQANTVACGSQLKQWYNAMLMYHQDYKTLPGPLLPATMTYSKAWNISSTTNWTVSDAASGYKLSRRAMTTANPDLLLTKYFKGNEGVFVCPGNRDMFENGRTHPSVTYANVNFGFAYKLNNQIDTNVPYFFGYWGTVASTLADPMNKMPKKLSQVRSAGKTAGAKGVAIKNHSEIWMMSDLDGINWDTDASSFYGLEDGNRLIKNRVYRPPHGTRQQPGRNFLFFDGSVRFYHFQFHTASVDAEPYNGDNATTSPKGY